MSEDRTILVGETEDEREFSLPVVELLTGRGFVTGKSGSGKSNTASVIAEELLESGFPLLIVDTDGEYYGLKEEYEMLHAGADEECDIQIGPEHAEQMATLALEENVPIILDVSGYLDEEVADELLRETARQLFVKEKKLKKPFLLVVEEVHEYIPEGGGVGETGKLLIKIGKRGRKHGLGILGISQRPADVKKDFITQANWLVWHRLTWDNDTNVVGRIIDTEYTELVSDLDDGQAFVQTDWTEADVRKIQFRRKRTFDAGATPGLDDFERPELKSVSDALVGDLQDISERKEREQDRIQELENELEKKETRIETLEDELESARDVSNAAKQMADALSNPETVQTELPDGNDEELRRLHQEVVELERECEVLEDDLETAEADREEAIEDAERLEAMLESRTETVDRLRMENERLRRRVSELEREYGDETTASESDAGPDGSDTDADGPDTDSSQAADDQAVQAAVGNVEPETDPIVQGDGDAIEFGYTNVDDGDGPAEIVVANERREFVDVLETIGVVPAVEGASGRSQCTFETATRVIATIAREGPLETESVADRVDRSAVAVQGLLSELRTESVLDRREKRRYVLAEDVRSRLDLVGSSERDGVSTPSSE
ncbi:DUF87 domain-containing protein [Salinadaptatus halalkaliphilus]|uniref:DUF87 domain-containing protein n=1 Tax=Salinadaptatus halalkaliphilus TaxID=2419781 RepID=A0A4S3TKZ7_9EURY|nr:DUF87 domain-containing protein [Salinadaptatus halalkaliphilus]THE64824.1 DUF87 domain-containing protein [Salinadaptatus halalkaliphilus]